MTAAANKKWAEQWHISSQSYISEYNPPKQYLQASSIILYEWCYALYIYILHILCWNLQSFQQFAFE